MFGLSYPNQSIVATLAATALPASYDTNALVAGPTSGMSQVVLYVTYVTGASETGTSIKIKFETGFTPTGSSTTDLYRMTAISVSAGTITLADAEYTRAGGAGATTYKFQVPVETADKYVKISFKESGVSSNAGTVAAKLTESGF